tara:strand:+ start:1570 stop:2370 length:801 start_codon:yes stop_codon:yes gene_type:complete
LNRTSWQITLDTLYALLFRELKTRFGAKRTGYFWAIAEPALQTLLMTVLFSFIGRNTLTGVPVMIFMLTGFVPFGLFGKMLKSVSTAVSANKGLLGYRQVSPIDPVVIRVMIELVTTLLVYVVLLFLMAWLGVEILSWMQLDVIPDNPLGVLAALLLLAAFSSGLGLIVTVGSAYWEDLDKIVSIATRPMILLSAVFYAMSMVPPQYWYLLSWNPVLHAIELGRDSFFVTYNTPVGSWVYLGSMAAGAQLIGLMLYQVARNRLKVS